jgi:hypothetical protein
MLEAFKGEVQPHVDTGRLKLSAQPTDALHRAFGLVLARRLWCSPGISGWAARVAPRP